jgi:hypothetical protein
MIQKQVGQEYLQGFTIADHLSLPNLIVLGIFHIFSVMNGIGEGSLFRTGRGSLQTLSKRSFES